MAEKPVTNEDRSEFEGGGVMPNTVFPKGADALTASDKLRLQSLTGQEDDPRAPVDEYFWYGNVRPDVKTDAAWRQQQINASRERLADRGRYDETPLPY